MAFPGAATTPRARVRRARLAPVARNHRRTRHACRQTSGDDRPLGIVTLEPVNDRKIGHAPARAVICSGNPEFRIRKIQVPRWP